MPEDDDHSTHQLERVALPSGGDAARISGLPISSLLARVSKEAFPANKILKILSTVEGVLVIS